MSPSASQPPSPPGEDPDTYFADLVEVIVGPFIEARGFVCVEVKGFEVSFQRDWALVTFSCDTVMMSSPWPVIVTIGEGPRLVPLWRVLRHEERARVSRDWAFRDRDSLATALNRLVEEGLAVYGPGLWDDLDRVRALAAEMEAEAKVRYENDVRNSALSLARFAFDHDRFQEAVDRYELLGPDALDAADRRRLYLARKRVAQGGAGSI